MTKKRPLLLLSNDDGINAKGIHELIHALRPVGDLIVVAPDGPRSGASGSITSVCPVHYTLLRQEEGLAVYKCSGTPVDCTKLALHDIVPEIPDLIIGGINHGDNSSINVHYSGTMGIVVEGCLKGIPSIGFSLCNHNADADFSAVLPYVRRIAEETLAKGLPKGVCLNVNFPNTSTLKGALVCRQTHGKWLNEFAKANHPYGRNYFWLTGEYLNVEPDAEDTDHWALAHNYVAITPTQIDMTAYGAMREIKTWNLNV